MTTDIKNKLLNFLLILVQVSLLFFVIHQFNIEKDTQLNKLLPVILIGFVVHYWLPFKYKLPFFILTSFAAVCWLLGIQGLLVIGIGLMLLAACHVPVNYNFRLLLVIGMLVALVAYRMELFGLHAITWLTPFIGTMFMMRIALYLYDVKYNDNFSNPFNRIAYFFLLPNVCFPLFPLIDFKVFNETYYNKKAHEINLLAVRRIFRGIVHLIVYRIIYYYMVPDPYEIDGLYSLFIFMVSTYTLILRLSGILHLALGILGLFGFNLPEIFDNYFFASSFNNIWQRINTYWREALMKVLYYPIYFKIRKIFTTKSMVVTILIVFVINWALHWYQWFWIRGSVFFAPNDFLFWMIFGIAVTINSVLIQKEGQSKKLASTSDYTVRSAIIAVLKPMGMFLVMSILWMLWSSSSITEWAYLLGFALQGTPQQWLMVAGILISFFIVALLLHLSYRNGILKQLILLYNRRITAFTFVFSLLLFAASFPKLTAFIQLNGRPFIGQLQENRLSVSDKRVMERGYYQKLLNNDNMSMQLSQIQMHKPKDWHINKAYIKTNDIIQKKIKPNTQVIYKGHIFTSNSFGLRDQEYTLAKPTGTYRFAILGGSYELGSGVDDNANFESQAEILLNHKYDRNIEVLNFAIGGSYLLEHEYNVKNNIINFNPDAIIYAAHTDEFDRVSNKLIQLTESQANIEDPFLLEVMKRSGVNRSYCRIENKNRLQPFIKPVIKWGYQSIVRECKKQNIIPVWVYVPVITDMQEPDNELSEIRSMAEEAGFMTLSLDGIYEGHDLNQIIVAPWDYHPNEKGHQLLAGKLFKELTSHAEELNLKEK
ncbi:MAG: hypothetical protein KDD41_07275 [Flavobacteriales bacterium]|nr:hypothetical protein [Flavobacteriales bacterium]